MKSKHSLAAGVMMLAGAAVSHAACSSKKSTRQAGLPHSALMPEASKCMRQPCFT
jgi:hypothetical protein